MLRAPIANGQREKAHGAFRTMAQGLLKQYIRPSKRLRWNPGARGVHVLAGMGDGTQGVDLIRF